MKTLNPDADFYTAQELARCLRVTEMTIYRMARRGELPYLRFGRSLRFPCDGVQKVLGQSSEQLEKLHPSSDEQAPL